MKMAIVSDDGVTISPHFGRATLFVVLNIENGEVVGRETRPKLGHSTYVPGAHGAPAAHHQHGSDPEAERQHAEMIANITDCEVLLTGGMGRGAYEHLRQRGIEPILTDIRQIDGAVQAYLADTLENRLDRLH